MRIDGISAIPELPQHYEKCLGAISRGWYDNASPYDIHVVSFANQPEPTVTTFATLGMSRYVLPMSEARPIRQEVLMSANDSFDESTIASVLLTIAEKIVGRGRAVLRGEVFGPDAALVPGASVTSAYFTNPSPFDDMLIELAVPPPPVVFAYAIPIRPAETKLAAEHGWRWFENALEEQDPDIWDLARSTEIVFRSERT